MYHIGVDAGGTKTYAAIMDHDKNILFSIKKGPGNMAINAEKASNNITDAIKACINSKYGGVSQFIVLGIAGIEKGNSKWQLKQYLEKKFKLPALVLNDAELAFYSVLGNQNGILAIAGTGSIFLGKNNSSIKVIGGWGHLLGDEGSAYHLGIQALKILIKEIDQESVQTEFAKTLANEYNILEASRLKEFVYSSSKADIAHISLLIHRLAQTGNKHALNLLENAGCELAKQAFQLVKKLEFKSSIKIGLKGSLLEKNEIVREYFKMKLKEYSADISFLLNNDPVVIGALDAWKSNMPECE
ncbi:N-acetylglucosamine kinase [Thermoactinomyces mirandus]|uniref:ATPase n=1 Tax=Thermoactinomyces mirandus TaxID=2756294 RepID=A0A7W1XUP8_9BACL|nr:BadF/BadG/BcrA/BcrD ATPase family protein [Thermoactinomyces mirandus]MBA4603596.1 ATPase [Thermoactinomyces mirandus]